MSHPFQSVPSGKGKYVFVPALILMLFGQIAFALTGKPLDTNQTHTHCDSVLPFLCQGIVGYELAHTAQNSLAILDSWDKVGARANAGFSLGIDYVYILGYANLIALACVWAGGILGNRKWSGANLGALIAWGVWLAALLDSTENIGLLVQLFSGAASEWALLAWLCASIKFALIAISLLYVLYGGLARLLGQYTISRSS